MRLRYNTVQFVLLLIKFAFYKTISFQSRFDTSTRQHMIGWWNFCCCYHTAPLYLIMEIRSPPLMTMPRPVDSSSSSMATGSTSDAQRCSCLAELNPVAAVQFQFRCTTQMLIQSPRRRRFGRLHLDRVTSTVGDVSKKL